MDETAPEVRDLLLHLGVALPGNKTTEMGQALLALAGAPKLARYTEPASFLSDLETGKLAPEFTAQWNLFLSEFSMRCPGEVDPATPRPYEDPAQIFSQLKSMAAAIQARDSSQPFFAEAQSKRESAYRALLVLAREKGRARAKKFENLYSAWLSLGGYRETPKHYVIKVVDLFRRAALEIAAKWVAEGRLVSRAQIFDLTLADIEAAQADPALDLCALAAQRSALVEKIRKSSHTARLLDSRGKVFYPPRKPLQAGELSGIPISPGLVRGRARVLHNAHEKALLPGEILVARATDPGWTPLFINAGGIILEIGGALQHGAVVAREYGIPCVSGVDQATELFLDGQLVEVDGSNGTVRILDGAIPPDAPLTPGEIQLQKQAAARQTQSIRGQSHRQALLRLAPILLLPFVVIFLIGGLYLLIRLIGGQSGPQALTDLAALWKISRPYLRLSLLIFAAPLLLFNIWKNRAKIRQILNRLSRSDQ